jgi:Flp pilus assembly protein TadD
MYRRDTTSPVAFECLARGLALHRENGSATEIENYIRRAVAADPHYAKAELDLGAILFNRGDFESAERSMRRSLKLQADCAEAHLGLGAQFCMQDKFEDAEPELLAAARLDPDDYECWRRLAALYQVRGALDSAITNFKLALLLNPWSADVHARLGEVYGLQGLHDQAIAELKQAELLTDVDDSGDEQGLGQAFDTLHEVPSAIAHYENLVRDMKRDNANPKYLSFAEKRLKELKETLTPVYVSSPQPKDYDAAALAKALGERLTANELTLVTNPLAGTPEMDRWAHEITTSATNDLGKAQLLFNTLSRHVDEGVQGQRTAQETFAVWRSPDISLVCQDYAFLYVALSRSVGLKTYNVFVEQDCNGRMVSHACAALFTGGKVLLVDPMYRWFGVPHKKFTVLDDVQNIAACAAWRHELFGSRIAAKLEPDWDFIQLYLAYALIEANQLDAARQLLPGEAAPNKEAWEWDLVRARIAISEKRDDDAIGLLKKVVAQNPGCDDAYGGLGLLYARNKKWTEARENFRLALKYCWRVAEANQIRAEIAEIDETVGPDTAATSEPIDADDYLSRGVGRAHYGEYDKAIADFTKAIELNPRYAKAYLGRGYCFSCKHKTDKALADYKEAVRFDPKNAENYMYLGTCYEKSGRHEDAATNYQKAVELGTHDPMVYGRLAWILLDGPKYLRNNQRGLDLASKACVLSDWKDSQLMVLLVYAYTLQEDFDSAVKLAETTLSLPDVRKDNAKYLRTVIADYKDWKSKPAIGADYSPNTNLWSTNQSPHASELPAPDLAQLKNSAKSGDLKAQVQLANLLYSGKGVPANHAEAYKWAAIAASNGDHDGIALQREFELFMSSAEVASGKAAADAFLKENTKQK